MSQTGCDGLIFLMLGYGVAIAWRDVDVGDVQVFCLVEVYFDGLEFDEIVCDGWLRWEVGEGDGVGNEGD